MAENDEKLKALGVVSGISTAGAGLGIAVASAVGVALVVPAVIGSIVGLSGYLIAKAIKK